MLVLVANYYWLTFQQEQKTADAEQSQILSSRPKDGGIGNSEASISLQKEWMIRRYKKNHPWQNITINEKDDSGGGLPKWSTQGKNKLAHAQGPVQYTSPVCENFNNTFRRPKHGCQMNPDTQMVHCAFENFRVDVDLIQSDRGGEALASVMGRAEQKEFPKYTIGAFATDRKPQHVPLPAGNLASLHYMGNVLIALEYPETTKTKRQSPLACKEVRKGTTMFITRYEYVNLYHTMTDWWNTYFSLPPINQQPVNIVFLDAHAQGSLDSVWSQLFGPYTYVQHLPRGGVCFEKAVLIPPGYASPLFSNGYKPRCPSHLMTEHFCEHVLKQYGLAHETKVEGNVVIIDRIGHISHPRSQLTGKRIISNLPDLEKEIAKVPGVTSVHRLQFETMTFRDQLQAVRRAHVLIGNHGAGLTHILFMDKQSAVIEFAPDTRDFFIYLGDWKADVEHNLIPDYDLAKEEGTGEISSETIKQTVKTVSRIMSGKEKEG
jgi:hypothetical protein